MPPGRLNATARLTAGRFSDRIENYWLKTIRRSSVISDARR